MPKKPFNKDIPSFIRDDKNWVIVWVSSVVHLRIDRLKYTTITRLVRTDVRSSYSKEPEQEVLAYDFNAKKWLNEIIRFNHEYIDKHPSQATLIQAVNSQWGTVNDDKGGYVRLVDGVMEL